MTPNEPAPASGTPEGAGREQLEYLVASYLDRLNSGETIYPLEVLADHPELGTEILKDLGTYLSLDSEPRAGPPLGMLGDYTLRREIGRGGMGVVYDAWQNSLHRQVALKVLPPGVGARLAAGIMLDSSDPA